LWGGRPRFVHGVGVVHELTLPTSQNLPVHATLTILSVMPTELNLPPLTLANILLAALPIFVLLYLMVGRQWNGSKAGLAGWGTAVLISILFFGAVAQLP
jgi:hypothetical protein